MHLDLTFRAQFKLLASSIHFVHVKMGLSNSNWPLKLVCCLLPFQAEHCSLVHLGDTPFSMQGQLACPKWKCDLLDHSSMACCALHSMSQPTHTCQPAA